MKIAVILSAGSGTRLRPLTDHTPKVMLPVNGKPLLQHLVEWVASHGVSDVCINLSYLPDVVVGHFGGGERFGVRMHYSHEDRLRGTAGALNGFRAQLESTFLVHYGDVYTSLDLSRMLAFHWSKGSAATLCIHPTHRPNDSDIVVMSETNRVTSVHHCPGTTQYGNLGNAACYILEPRVLHYLPDDSGEYDFIKDVFPRMLASGEPLFGYPTDELLADMGTPERYARLRARVEAQ